MTESCSSSSSSSSSSGGGRGGDSSSSSSSGGGGGGDGGGSSSCSRSSMKNKNKYGILFSPLPLQIQNQTSHHVNTTRCGQMNPAYNFAQSIKSPNIKS